MSRGWTWIKEEGADEALSTTNDALAREWSGINAQIASRGIDRQVRAEMLGEHDDEAERWPCPECDGTGCEVCGNSGVDEEAKRQATEERRMAEKQVEVRLEIIEQMLERNNARMMRPYEHHGEEESIIKYMEERGDHE